MQIYYPNCQQHHPKIARTGDILKDLSQNACHPVHDKCLAALKVVRGNSQLNVDWISSLKAGPSLMLQSKGQEDHFC